MNPPLLVAAVLAALCVVSTAWFSTIGSQTESYRKELFGVNVPNLPPSEIGALYDLYNSTNGPNWLWVNNSFVGYPWTFNNASNPCTEDWQGVICTSTLDNGYLHVLKLKLDAMNLHGQLPNSLDEFTQIQSFFVTTNRITGTIPATIGNFTQLVQLNLAYNSIAGTIPESMSNLTQLQVLYLNNNLLTGRMPEFFATFLGLVDFVINGNKLTGTVPASFGDLTLLEQFNVGNNRLAGNIPGALGNMASLELFAVNSNYFSGTFPKEFAHLSNLMYIYIDDNGFYGPIPAFLGNLTKLEYIAMNINYFTGQLPKELGHLQHLLNMYFHDNLLEGTIPPEFGQIGTLQLMDLHANKLTGPIPAELSNLTVLTVLNLYTNLLSNTLPPELGLLSELQTMDFSQNYLTGTLPEEYGQLESLQFYKIHECRLHGTIPHTIGDMTALSYLSLHSNHLTSTIPATLQQLQYLNALFIFNNMFSGTIDDFINSTTQLNLAIVQISGNALTGQIPDDLFALPELQTVILGSNCFYGTLPTAMCNATKVKTLSLDGLRSGTTCQDLMFPGTSKAYVLTSHITHGIPTCLFEMESVNTLHLSGNGLTGPLPDQVSISGNLVDLSLSHNKLTGHIPKVFQERIWYNFDLSYNKFKGTLTDNFATVPGNLTVLRRLGLRVINASLDEYSITSAALFLRNNRLSHTIPAVIVSMLNVSVLEGNLYGCSLDQSDLPSHDDGRFTYSCGSNSFNISYYIYIAALSAALALAGALYYWRKEVAAYVDIIGTIETMDRWFKIIDWYDNDSSRAKSRLHRYKYVTLLFDEICKIAAWCTLYIVVVMMPLYAIVSNYYGTHKFEYAWSVSAAFLSGSVALGLLLLFFCILLILLIFLYKWLIQAMKRFLHNLPKDYHFSVLDSFQDEQEENEERYSSFSEKVLVYAVFFMVNVTVVGAANIGYLFAAIYGDASYQTLAQLSLSVFKLIWNNFGSIYLIRWTHHYLARSATKEWKSKGAGFFAIQLFVQLFNYIIVPCMVVSAISPNCFNNAVVAAPTVTSYFYYEQCSLYSALFGCLVPVFRVASTSFSPPFTYSYECSSSLITYYAPTFVYLGFIVTFVSPMWDVVMRNVHIYSPRGTRWFAVVDFWVPLVLHPVRADTVQYDNPYDIFNPYIDANYILVTITAYLGVLLTFGFVFPPLAVVMLVSICSTVYVSRIEVGRFLHDAIADNVHKYTDIIEGECQGVGSIPKLIQCIRIIVVFACLFYTPFLFDTLGDSVGIYGSFWVFLVVPMFPLIILLMHNLYRRYRTRYPGNSPSRAPTTSIELRLSGFLRSEKDKALAESAMHGETAPTHDLSGLHSVEMGTAAAAALAGRSRAETNDSQVSSETSGTEVFNALQRR